MQGRKRDADIDNRLGDTGGKERVGCTGRGALTYIHHRV